MSFIGRILAAGVGSGALWLGFGAQAFSDGSNLASRLTLLPHPGSIAAPLLVLIWLARPPFLEPRSGQGLPPSSGPIRARGDLWWLLFTGALAFLPWLPGTTAAFLMWQGPVLLLVLAVVAAASMGLTVLAPGASKLPAGRTAPVAAALLAGALYAWGPFQLETYVPGGDEPHYLVMTQSLLSDGDLKIENNHRQRDYHAYHPGDLPPHYLNRGKDGQIYSVHAPGLSALVAPAFALGGYPGVVAFLIALAALGTALVWQLGFALTASTEAAWVGWATVALSAPFACLAFGVYPDVPAGVLLLVGLSVLVWGSRFGPWRWAGCGLALGLLPWLHTRYVVLAGAVACLVILRQRFSPEAARRLCAFLAAPLVSALVWFWFFYAIYGRANPSAPYGGFNHTDTSVTNMLPGLPGLFFDQQFGLLANAPAFVLGLVGLFVMLRQHDTATLSPAAREARPARLALELCAVIAPYVIIASSYRMWWGGFSSPARFLAPLTLVFGVTAACGWAWCRTHATKLMGLAALGVTVFITSAFLFVSGGDLVYNTRDGYARWLEWVNPVVDLTTALPSFHRDPPAIALEHALVWVGCLTAAWLFSVHMERRASISRGLLTLSVMLAVASAAMVASTIVWRLTGSAGTRVTSSQAWLLSRYDERRRPLGVQYPAGLIDGLPRMVSPTYALSRLEIMSNARHDPEPPPLLYLRSLPPGRYEVHLTGRRAVQGTLTASTGRNTLPFLTVDLAADRAAAHRLFELTLPVTLLTLTVAGDDTAKRSISRAWLTPLALGTSLAVPESRPATRVALYGGTTTYFIDQRSYPEPTGFWIAPETQTDIVFQPNRLSLPLRLFLRNAPVENQLTIEAQKWTGTLRLDARQEQMLELPASSDGRAVHVRLFASAGFVPRDVDPSSQDARSLAVWIEPK